LKKKILVCIAMLCMVLSMAGCSKEATDYMSKLDEVSSWEAVETTGNMAMEVEVNEQKFGVKIDYSGYTNVKDGQAEVTFNVKEVSALGATLDTKKDTFKISPIKMYIGKTEMYINTTPIKEIVTMMGGDVSTVEELKKQYIGLDMKEYFKERGLDVTSLNSKETNEIVWKMLKQFNVEVPVKQDKETYTVELDTNQMITLLFDLAKSYMKQNSELLMAQYKQMGLTDQQVKEAVGSIDQIYNDETKAKVMKSMDGSRAKLTTTFGKDSYTNQFNYVVKSDNLQIAFSMVMDGTCKKAGIKAVEMPKDTKVYPMNKLMNATIKKATVQAKIKAQEKALSSVK